MYHIARRLGTVDKILSISIVISVAYTNVDVSSLDIMIYSNIYAICPTKQKDTGYDFPKLIPWHTQMQMFPGPYDMCQNLRHMPHIARTLGTADTILSVPILILLAYTNVDVRFKSWTLSTLCNFSWGGGSRRGYCSGWGIKQNIDIIFPLAFKVRTFYHNKTIKMTVIMRTTFLCFNPNSNPPQNFYAT